MQNGTLVSDYEVTVKNDSYVLFSSTCACFHPDHSLTVSIEKVEPDPDWSDDNILASIDFATSSPDLSELPLFERVSTSLKMIWAIVQGKQFQLTESFIFRGRKHIRSIADALNASVDYLEANEKD